MHAKLPEQFLHVRGEQEQFGEQSHEEHKEHSDNLAELFAVLLLAWFLAKRGYSRFVVFESQLVKNLFRWLSYCRLIAHPQSTSAQHKHLLR